MTRTVTAPLFRTALLIFVLSSLPSYAVSSDEPIRVAIVGLVHGHVQGLLASLPRNSHAHLVAIVEHNTALSQSYAARYHLDPKLFHSDIDEMIEHEHPDAVLVYTTIADHRRVIEAAARHGVSSMVEKPLATTVSDALAIRNAAVAHKVQVLVNYETTWYASNREAYDEADAGKLGELRKVVVHDGHEGPKEIGVGPEWLPWLTDPAQNGAGALFDFGCYGADLITLLMHGEVPLSVTAVTQTDKPGIYPRVDDDATIIVQYPKAQAVLMPSWNWPFGRKDMEVYGATGYAITIGSDKLRSRFHGEDHESEKEAPPLPNGRQDALAYLAAVLHGQITARGDLSALDTNMVVMQILEAARDSARTRRTVELRPLPQ